MPEHHRLLFVIADGERVRFVRPSADNAFGSDQSMDTFSAHKRSADLGSDHPGDSVHTASSAHHALAPRYDVHELETENFARAVAAPLKTAAAADAFD
jgi:hypothetical protein